MQLSQEIFNILKGANIKIKLFDPMGNKTLDPELSARFYAYDNDFLITIREEEDGVELVVQAGASFNFNEHNDLLNSIKKAGHNAMAEYNIRKFDKNIELKDFAHDVVKEDDRTEKAMKDMQPSAVTGYYEITDFWKEHTQMWDKSVDEVMQMIYEWTWIEMTTATRDRDELAKRTLAIVVDALRNKKDDMTFDDMIAQLESKNEDVRRLRELSGIAEAPNEGTQGCADCEWIKDETDGDIDTCDECAAEKRQTNESEKRWKQTSMSPEEAIEKYGKENVKVKKGALRNGDDMVEVFVESINEGGNSVEAFMAHVVDHAKEIQADNYRMTDSSYYEFTDEIDTDDEEFMSMPQVQAILKAIPHVDMENTDIKHAIDILASGELLEAETESYSPGDEMEDGVVSNCCGAQLMDYNDGHGRCSDCKEMAAGEPDEEYYESEVSRLKELSGITEAPGKGSFSFGPKDPQNMSPKDITDPNAALIHKGSTRGVDDPFDASGTGHADGIGWSQNELDGAMQGFKDVLGTENQIQINRYLAKLPLNIAKDIADQNGYGTYTNPETGARENPDSMIGGYDHIGNPNYGTDAMDPETIAKIKDPKWRDTFNMQDPKFKNIRPTVKPTVKPKLRPNNLGEGYTPATGSMKTSYIQLPENTKLIIKHTKGVNEEVRGSRSRNIKALFIENSAGERFRFPHKYLQGAKAMANHVSNGGTPYDAIGESIITLCTEVAQCTQFLRHVRTNKLTNESNVNIVEAVKQKLKEFKNTVKSLQTSRGYNDYQAPTTAIVEDNDKESVDLTDKFMYNTFETANMDSVLETVARIIKERDSMTDLTKSNMNRLYDMIKNKEDFKLNIDPNDPEHPDNEDPIKYSGGNGAMAKLVSHLSFLAMNSKNDEVFNLLSQISGEMYSLPKEHVVLLAKIAKYLDKNNKAPAKEPAMEDLAEATLNNLRRKIA